LWNFTVEPTQARTEEEAILNLARAMARRLWANLQLREAERQVGPEAYRHYLHGRYYWNQRTLTGLSAAIGSFNAALKLEPNYVDALTGLADSWLLMPLYGAVAPNAAMPKARAAAERALQLDPGDSRAHAVIGVINMQYDWQWVTAESHLRKALTLNPNDATAEQWLGELKCYRARFDECRRHLRTASGLDPLSPILRMMQGSPDLYSGHFEAAVAAYLRTLDELPDFEFTHIALGHAYIGLEAWDDAIASYERLLPDLGLAIIGGPLIFALAKRGESQRAQEMLLELESLARQSYVPPSKLAIAYLGLGDRARAISWLERAVEAHDDRLVYLGVDNLFSELRSDPDFREIAAAIGLLEVLEQQ
jgi:serine/threonine-protein kinase